MRHKTSSPLNRKPPFWVQVLVSYCVVALSSFLIVNEQSPALANCQEYQNEKAAQAVSSIDLTVVKAHPDHIPFAYNPVFSEPEIRGSSESQDDHDDDGSHKICGDVPVQINSCFHTKKNLLLQLRLADESRTTISLVILHHSWKSFLV